MIYKGKNAKKTQADEEVAICQSLLPSSSIVLSFLFCRPFAPSVFV